MKRLMITVRRLRPLIALALALAALLGARAAALAGGPWYVATSGDDGNDCLAPAAACRTIGAAIARAAAGDTVSIAAGAYVENLILRQSISLVGAGAGATIVDGGARGPVVQVFSGSAQISGLTIRNGATAGAGGGIQNAGSLTVEASVIAANSASLGGGIFTIGGLTLRESSVLSNTATFGGGIYTMGWLSIERSDVRGNSAVGGATQDTAVGGGGIYVARGGSATVDSSSIVANSISSPRACRGGGAQGGGAYVEPGARLVLYQSTVVANTAADYATNCGKPAYSSYAAGGGIANDGYLALYNSTLSGNQAIADSQYDYVAILPPGAAATATGGGIANTGLGELNGVTVSANEARASVDQGLPPPFKHALSQELTLELGGGIASTAELSSTSGLKLLLTLIAGNQGQTSPDCAGPVGSQGYNLIQRPQGCALDQAGASDTLGVDPLLGPLADNGGRTRTYALTAGSPAIDAGAGCEFWAGFMFDQRGYSRPFDGDGDGEARCDIGAYELAPPIRLLLPLVRQL